jgi:hypothetical protein
VISTLQGEVTKELIYYSPSTQLFGGSAFTKEYVFGLEDYSQATIAQNFIASTAGSVSSIAISQPLDIIKTRIQNQNFESKVGGLAVIRDLVRNEGVTAFFKGLTPKVERRSHCRLSLMADLRFFTGSRGLS